MGPAKCGVPSADSSARYSRPGGPSSRRPAWRPLRAAHAASCSHNADHDVLDHHKSARPQQQLQASPIATDSQQQWQPHSLQQPLQRQRPTRPTSLQQQHRQNSQLRDMLIKQQPQHQGRSDSKPFVQAAVGLDSQCSSSSSSCGSSLVGGRSATERLQLQQHRHSAQCAGNGFPGSDDSFSGRYGCTSSNDSSSGRSGSSNASSSSEGRSDHQPKPTPTATSGAPPSDTASNSSSSSSNDKHLPDQQEQQTSQQQQQQQQQQEGQSQASSSTASDEIDAAVDAMLDKTWKELKRDLKRDLPPEQAAMIDKWEVGDIQTDKVFREIAEQQLGPILELMGIREDPYTFFIDMFKLALMMQLLSAAVVFYTAELGLGLDAGDAFRAVAGLAFGYFLRLSIKIEHLAWPVYNAVVQLLIQDNAVYEPTEVTAQEKLATINKLGLTIACAFFIPKLLFGWQNDECWQIVVPMIGGLFFFDVCYILALLIKLWGRDDE